MIKLRKPHKKIIIDASASFYDYPKHYEKKVPLKTFLKWCKSQLPKDAKDIELEIDEHWEYDDCVVTLRLNWKKAIINPNYDSQLIKYNKKLNKKKNK